MRSVRPGASDFRDLAFRSNVALAPRSTLFAALQLAVKNRQDSRACTGFDLSLVLEYLLRCAKRANATVSPDMPYSMARREQQFHLTDKAEPEDLPGRPYGRSVLYLISEWFEGGKQTEVHGRPKYFDTAFGGRSELAACRAPGTMSTATRHSDFDDDAATRAPVPACIKAQGRAGHGGRRGSATGVIARVRARTRPIPAHAGWVNFVQARAPSRRQNASGTR